MQNVNVNTYHLQMAEYMPTGKGICKLITGLYRPVTKTMYKLRMSSPHTKWQTEDRPVSNRMKS
jgi:hypothetical protein